MQLTSPTGTRTEQGFTLLELMLVLLITGLLISTVAVNYGTKSKPVAQLQSGELLTLFRNIQQQAVFSGQELGVLFLQNKLLVTYFDQGNWHRSDNWVEYQFNDLLNLKLSVDGQQLTLPTSVQEKNLTPQLIFFSDGQYTPFTLELDTANTPPVKLTGLYLQEVIAQ